MLDHNLSLKKDLEGESKLQKNINLNSETFSPFLYLRKSMSEQI